MTRFFLSILPPHLCESGVFGSLNVLSLLLFCVRAPGKKYARMYSEFEMASRLSLNEFHSFGRKIINKITHSKRNKTKKQQQQQIAQADGNGDIPSDLLKLILYCFKVIHKSNSRNFITNKSNFITYFSFTN